MLDFSQVKHHNEVIYANSKKKKKEAGQTQQTNHKPLNVNNEVIEHTQKYYDVLSVLSIQRVGESVSVAGWHIQ